MDPLEPQQTVNESSLGPPDLVAETLIAGAKTESILGAQSRPWNLSAEISTPADVGRKLTAWAQGTPNFPAGEIRGLSKHATEMGLVSIATTPRTAYLKSIETARMKEAQAAALEQNGDTGPDFRKAMKDRDIAGKVATLAEGALGVMTPAPVPQTLPEQVATLADLQSRVATYAGKIDIQIGNVIRGSVQGHGEPQAALPGVEAGTRHEKRAELVRRLAMSPQDLQDVLVAQTEDWQEHAPSTALSANATTVRAVGYLTSALPQVRQSGPLVPEMKPSESEMSAFARAWDAVSDPLIILKEATAGTLTPSSVQAVATVYPALYQRMQTLIVEKLTAHKGEIPYKQRLMLSALLGEDMDGTAQPSFVMSNQMAYARSQMEQAQQATSRPRVKSSTLSDRSKTETQDRQDPSNG